MKLEEIYVRDDQIAAMQYFTETKDDKGAVKCSAYFDIILKSGVIIHVKDGCGIYSKAVEQLKIE
jgi:hypothetical protein